VGLVPEQRPFCCCIWPRLLKSPNSEEIDMIIVWTYDQIKILNFAGAVRLLQLAVQAFNSFSIDTIGRPSLCR
jgi:hypothetical protein